MFQNDLLDLAIGLVFVWFILSLLISVINEGFALVFRIRAKHLWLGIGRLLNPQEGKYSRKFWDTVIRLPFSRRDLDLRPIARAGSADQATKPRFNTDLATDARRMDLQRVYDAIAPMVTDVALAGRKSKLTKISGEVFADAITTLGKPVHPADLEAAATALGWQQAAIATLTEALKAIPRDRLVDRVTTIELDLGAEVTAAAKDRLYGEAAKDFTMQDVADFFKGNPKLSQAIENAASAVGIDQRLAAVKTTVQTWFDREMEQLSALYRRQNRKVLAFMALPIVLIFQANTLSIIADLRSDTALREAITNEAVAVSDSATLGDVVKQKCQPTAANGTMSTTTAATPASTSAATSGAAPATPAVGSTAAPATAASTPPATGAATAGSPAAPATGDPFDESVRTVQCAAKIVQYAGKFALVPDFDRFEAINTPTDRLDRWDFWGYEFNDFGWFGRLITLVALMFGAQFWFDVLRRLVGIRGTLSGEGKSSAG